MRREGLEETRFQNVTPRERHLPQVQLVLVGLGNRGQAVQVTEQLDPVVRLDVVHPVAEHLQQGVKDSPGVRLEHIRQQLAWAGGGDTALVCSFCVKSISFCFVFFPQMCFCCNSSVNFRF